MSSTCYGALEIVGLLLLLLLLLWRRKPCGIEITSLSPYVYGNARLTAKMYRVLRLCSSWTPRLDFYWCLALLFDGETATNKKRMVQRARERESREGLWTFRSHALSIVPGNETTIQSAVYTVVEVTDDSRPLRRAAF